MSIPPGPPLVVIDDMDSGIIYSNSSGQDWFLDESKDDFGNFGPPYLHTLHATQTDASFSYTFNGSYIYVYGTVNVQNVAGVLQPSWECFIDGVSTGITDNQDFPSENNLPMCQAPDTLPDGPHEITVNVTTDGSPFWFDDIKYRPSPAAAIASTIMIDNSDKRIKYQHWFPMGKTGTFTQVPGATMAMNFTGTSLSWYTRIPGHPFSKATANAKYTIDGGAPTWFSFGGSTNFNHIVFETPDLTPGPHSLLVTHGGTQAKSPLTLDYVIVSNAAVNQATTMISVSPTSSISTGLCHSSSPIVKSDSRLGIIMGAVFSGLVCIGATVAILFWHRRKAPPQPHILPFMQHRERSVPVTHMPIAKPCLSGGTSGTYVPGNGGRYGGGRDGRGAGIAVGELRHNVSRSSQPRHEAYGFHGYQSTVDVPPDYVA